MHASVASELAPTLKVGVLTAPSETAGFEEEAELADESELNPETMLGIC